MSKVEFLIDHSDHLCIMKKKLLSLYAESNCAIESVYPFSFMTCYAVRKSCQCLRTIVCKHIVPLVFFCTRPENRFFCTPWAPVPTLISRVQKSIKLASVVYRRVGLPTPSLSFCQLPIYIYIVGKNKNRLQEIRNVAIKSSVIHPVGWKCGEGFSVSLTIAYYARQINRFKKAHKKSFLQKVWKIEG